MGKERDASHSQYGVDEHLLNCMNPGRKICAPIVALFFLSWGCITNGAQKPKDEDCLACHSDASLTKEVGGKTVSVSVDPVKLKHSIHGALFRCVDCHTDVKTSPHEAPPEKLTCAQCHAGAQQVYGQSYHAKANKTGGSPAAQCQDCHGSAHDILPASDAKSPISHANIPATCGRCHGQKFLMEANGASAQAYLSYQESVHGLANAKGSKTSAVCTDCHGAHAILPANNASSTIYKFNVPDTCGKCHKKVELIFMQSIHGQSIARGNGLAPVCTDCHGIHSIKAHIDPNSSVSDQNLARTTCARCHEGVRLSQELGVAENRVSTYLESYHGLASKGGSAVVANCASCHGVHNILPSSDPHSTINHANLDTTCGQCHKGVTQRFTVSKIHMDGDRAQDAGTVAVRWIKRFYLTLIFLVIGAMFVHNAILWMSKSLSRRRARQKTVVRMTRNQRCQHLLLLTSFVLLVATGFALKYPNSWFAEMLGMGERLRGILHRVAGVVLIGGGIYHLIYLSTTREGRRLVRDFVPASKDGFDAWATMRYYLGLSREKPRFGRFNYAEKAEYWALVWGSLLMALTGIMLWDKVFVGNLLAHWWLDAATAVHFYEAILATVAIVVWHFYMVIFDPDVYPMNWAWRDGKMSVERYREEHGLDSETLGETQPDVSVKAVEATGGEAAGEGENKLPPG